PDRLVPGRPAVIGVEGRDRPVQALERHDDPSARLYDRLAADALVVTGRLDRHAPGEPTVRGGAHQLAVTLAEVVELRVAVPTERARGVVVAGGPVLVEIDPVRDWRRDAERIAP